MNQQETLEVKGIKAMDKTVKDILNNVKYTVDFFQREYRWQRKHIEQLIEDLTNSFLSDYDKGHDRREVQNYERYFLGPFVLSQKKDGKSIIDGQQRLTSLTLLLIYLNNLQKGREEKVSISDLIFSEKFGQKSFNLQIPERHDVMEALFKGDEYNNNGKDESIQNLTERYKDIQELFPDELKGKALPYFIDWLIENVALVEILTYSDDNAYKIFETMNDRGLNLTPSEMLKGYIISNLTNGEQQQQVNNTWRNIIFDLKKLSKEEDLEFFKAWLRAKYAETIRPGKKGAANEDFEKIGTRFHQWVRDNKDNLGLKKDEDFFKFVAQKMKFYAEKYEMISKAANNYDQELESIFYINERGLALSIYYPLLMAPIRLDDTQDVIKKKLKLVSKYLETYVVLRAINYKSYSHSAIRYTMYSLVKEVRDKDLGELADILKNRINDMDKSLKGFSNLRLHGQNKRFIKFLLARMTSHIERNSGEPDNFKYYMSKQIQVEHIWADKFEEHLDEFNQRDDFENWRNMVGDLLILEESFNKSYGDMPYKEKRDRYLNQNQNYLAKSLVPGFYSNNPKFIRSIKEKGLPFEPHEHFKKEDIKKRQSLYQKILEQIYSVDNFDNIIE